MTEHQKHLMRMDKKETLSLTSDKDTKQYRYYWTKFMTFQYLATITT